MSETTDIIGATASSVSAIAAIVAAIGVWYARSQLKTSRDIAQLQFEDALGKEYRELANRLKPKALLGEELSEQEYQDAFDELFHYVDLSNEQVSLRQRGRIGLEVWESWRAGISTNLALPAFSRAWREIKAKSSSFQELRRFELEGAASDPRNWK
jgi:hypothetical protein